VKKSIYFVVLLLAAWVPHAGCADYSLERGFVLAKIIGPSAPTPETAEPQIEGLPHYFRTTVEISKVANGFLKELKGKKITVRTDSFDNEFIGKTLPLQLTARRKPGAAEPEFAFEHNELAISYDLGLQTINPADYAFTHGIVFAKIFGPNKATPETVEPGSGGDWGYFYTTIGIVDVKDGFGSELKGKRLLVRTGTFDELLIGKTVPLKVTLRTKGVDFPTSILLPCSELKGSYTSARFELDQSAAMPELKPSQTLNINFTDKTPGYLLRSNK
jgi:hypothetical protein